MELNKLEVHPIVNGVSITDLGSGNGDQDDTIEVGLKDMDNLVVLLHAYSNMIKLGIQMKSELSVYDKYIVVHYSGAIYTVVGYISMDAYTLRGYHYVEGIGNTILIKDGLQGFPPPEEV